MQNDNLVPIGMDCTHNAIASALNFLGHIDLMLEITAYDFLYRDVDSFISLDVNGPITDYLSKTNPLIFDIRPHSVFLDTGISNRDKLLNDSIWIETPYVEYSDYSQFETILQRYSDESTPLVISLNVSALKEDYKQMGANCPRGTHSFHLVNVFDKKGQTCKVVDTQFHANGYVPIANIFTAMSELEHPEIHALLLKEPLPSFSELLLEHLKHSLFTKQIGGHEYYRENPLVAFMRDLPEILLKLERQYGIYAHPVLSYILNGHRLERRGCGALYNLFHNQVPLLNWKTISQCAVSSGRLWYQFDTVLDKNFLRGKSIAAISDDLFSLLQTILWNDRIVYANMEGIYRFLSENKGEMTTGYLPLCAYKDIAAMPYVPIPDEFDKTNLKRGK